MSTQTTEAKPATEETPKKEVMGIERDDVNARVSFTQDGNLLIITMPIGRMSRALAHGFLYELHTVVTDWHEERKKTKLVTRDEVNKFSFKNAVSSILRK